MIILLMGVSGAGKTTVGRRLADDLGWVFADADDFHPVENVERMNRGIPLGDAERAPWLAALRRWIEQQLKEERDAVLACSALRAAYRRELEVDARVRTVYLAGDRERIAQRLRDRHAHFAGESLLESQLATLEEPDDALRVSIEPPPEAIALEIAARLGLRPAPSP